MVNFLKVFLPAVAIIYAPLLSLIAFFSWVLTMDSCECEQDDNV